MLQWLCLLITHIHILLYYFFLSIYIFYIYITAHLCNSVYNNIIFVLQKKGIVPSTSTTTTTTTTPSGGPSQRPTPPSNIGMFKVQRRFEK